jgi:putative flippase GtrA
MADFTMSSDEDEGYYGALQQAGLTALHDVAQPFATPLAGRHRRKPPRRYAVVARRLVLFNAIGLAVFALGTLLQWPLVKPLGPAWSYAVQTVVSVEASWALNRWLTWRDRHPGTGTSLWRWNAQRAVSTALNYGFYLGLMRLTAMGWLDANVISTALFVPVNYVVGDRWSLAPTVARIAGSWRPQRRFRLTHRWALTGILVLQAGLSVRLLRANTAFGDEALYLWAGHLEWSHWLHGTTSATLAAFPSWFSGAPIIYPPLGAVGDSLGGLAGARLLSLAFMLGASALLYDITRRLLDTRSALFSVLLFAILGPTQSLGAFATYDPMAIFLLALATWTGTVAANRKHLSAAGALLVLAGLTLTLADATKYATALWSPAVVALVGVAFWRRRSLRAGAIASSVMAACWGADVAAALVFAGKALYWHGILFTTLQRSASTAPASVVFHETFGYAWPVLILGFLALISSAGQDWSMRALCCTTMGAALLAPLNQARIHTTTSLQKHVDFGALFLAITAGYVLARISRIDGRQIWQVGVSVGGCSMILFGSTIHVADHLASFWPRSTGMIAAVQSLVTPSSGPILMEEFDVGYYYLHDRVYPGQISNMFGYLTWDSARRVELSGTSAITYAISQRYFAVVEIDGQNIPLAMFKAISNALAVTPGYKRIYNRPFIYDHVHDDMEVWKRVKA